jgi:predicted transcriptional regulator
VVDTENGAVVLLPIYPEFANAIFSGKKKVEFRRKIFKRPIKRIVVYSTMPEGKILGYFDVEDIVVKEPVNLWKIFGSVGCIDKTRFDAYYRGYKLGYGIKVKKAVAYQCAIELDSIGKKAPQGYTYLCDSEVAALK